MKNNVINVHILNRKKVKSLPLFAFSTIKRHSNPGNMNSCPCRSDKTETVSEIALNTIQSMNVLPFGVMEYHFSCHSRSKANSMQTIIWPNLEETSEYLSRGTV